MRRAHPNAQLISGIRARLVRADGSVSEALLFTDNIVATQRSGNLYVHAVFEVKSGPRGGAEATSQIHRWIEEHLDDGFEIQLSHGERFRYAPGSVGRGQVIGLARAERHVITPSGTEHLGLGSAEQVAAPTSRHALPQTADEISFLARTVLEGTGI
jgi:hypothetical protein